jgi:multisubunit Na+/H+ antiporter MnhB subunit
VVLGVVAAAMGLFSLAFWITARRRPAARKALLAAFAIGVVGLVVTVIQFYRRKPG